MNREKMVTPCPYWSVIFLCGVGTFISIRLIPEATDGHDIDCKIPGIGQMGLKSEFVKKVAD